MKKRLNSNTIKTSRFLIKKLTFSEINQNYLSWFLDKETKKFIENIPKNLLELKKYIKKTLKKKNVLFYSIYFKNQHIGNIKFEKVNLRNSSTYLGILIGERTWRNKGVGYEALKKMINYLYLKYGIFKFYLGVNKNNLAAINLYRKLGFKEINKNRKKKTLKMFHNFINSKIVIGSAQFGSDYGINNRKGELSLNEIKRIKNYAQKNSINSFETAQSYGSAEKKLGKLNLTRFKIITKLQRLNKIYSKKAIDNHIKNSLKKLKVKKIYGLLVHDVNDLTGPNGSKVFKLLEKYKKKQIVKNLGVVVYNLKELKKVTKKFKFDIISVPCNIFDRRFIESEVIKKLKGSNVKIYARSIFLQGLLLLNVNKIPANFLKWKNEFLRFNNLSNRKKISKVEICTKFVLENDLIDKIIIGCDSFNQFKNIVDINYNKKLNLKFKFKTNNEKLINPSLW